MNYYYDKYEQTLARLRLRRRLASKAYPPARVTDNIASWHLRRKDHDSNRTPTREAHKTLAASHERISLILQNILIWGAVAWAVWYVFL